MHLSFSSTKYMTRREFSAPYIFCLLIFCYVYLGLSGRGEVPVKCKLCILEIFRLLIHSRKGVCTDRLDMQRNKTEAVRSIVQTFGYITHEIAGLYGCKYGKKMSFRLRILFSGALFHKALLIRSGLIRYTCCTPSTWKTFDGNDLPL